MEKFKRAVRFFFMILILLMASFGLALPFGARERYQDKEVQIEEVYKREDEEEEDQARL